MNRSSIYLAGWLTTVVVAVVIIIGMSNGAFGAGRDKGTTEAQPPAVQPSDGLAPPPDAASASASGQSELVYVYPDGSPAPTPSARLSKKGKFEADDKDEREEHRNERKLREHDD